MSLIIASYDWRPDTIAVAVGTHFLPNLDVVLIKTKLVKEDFHCSITHTLVFAILISMLFLPFSPRLALIAFISLITHYLADLGSTIGQKLFWPISQKKFTLALWEDTGYWGKKMWFGYYRQKGAWIAEGIVFAFLIYRFIVIF
ncbi:metal-dependent hydrolase [Candidatus Aminicenantes bacterium AC-335-A11]|nr:metal-dependent hydrolase [SCandidatus Aminicenantes bacterium Aminicenantia_JdfR_composite]MCP2597922.1 metal-dependent hydrolase [Candidatus Aminicenantes bacterium AC-335-L06]MCP2605883.1 metal-dependent hydrolase [Candidatus Aminicenantes bacterium AC-335-O07]MCP2606096.1 metal-dependent hydrolase [Candidatus Aminicenantes bacterium AC-708-I09]MCP2619102.1 metal-dependent hydrolase [Candidatus Aminicenantes bacterium AC-335-A11]